MCFTLKFFKKEPPLIKKKQPNKSYYMCVAHLFDDNKTNEKEGRSWRKVEGTVDIFWLSVKHTFIVHLRPWTSYTAVALRPSMIMFPNTVSYSHWSWKGQRHPWGLRWKRDQSRRATCVCGGSQWERRHQRLFLNSARLNEWDTPAPLPPHQVSSTQPKPLHSLVRRSQENNSAQRFQAISPCRLQYL